MIALNIVNQVTTLDNIVQSVKHGKNGYLKINQ